MTVEPRTKLLFFVAEDWYFLSHRLGIARAARDQGYGVCVVTRVGRHRKAIEEEGFKLYDLRLKRSSRNLLSEMATILQLVRIYRREKPHLVHHVAVKPVLYGSYAARLSGVPVVINALAGMGYLYASTCLDAKLLRFLLEPAFRTALKRPENRVILQNPDDVRLLVERGLVRQAQVALIRGSGVDTNLFSPRPETDGPPIVILAARMLSDKGVTEFVEAARALRKQGVSARFALVGDADPDNPASIPAATLRGWEKNGDVEWWGFRSAMPKVFHEVHIATLPSYREGLPKVLLEAASCGRPIVATDTPGCREIVRHGVNGFLVPVRDPLAIAGALRQLINDKDLRQKMGKEGRKLVLNEFTEERIVGQTIGLYKAALR